MLLLLACVVFSAFTVQLAGVMHDCGHRAVFSSIRSNDLLGSFAAGAIGMSLMSWREHHNRHHAFPNQDTKDPDFQVPLTAFSANQMSLKSGRTRLLSRYQAFYFYGILATASLSNRVGGVVNFLRRPSEGSLIEHLANVPVVAALTVGPFLVFPLEKALFVFVVVHLVSGLYLANCFAPNHKGMTTLRDDAEISFFEQQVVTARSVRGGILTEIFMVGLNHQIEHHLFPSTPRNKLKQLRPSVIEACEAEGIAYGEEGFVESGRTILRSLYGVSRQA